MIQPLLGMDDDTSSVDGSTGAPSTGDPGLDAILGGADSSDADSTTTSVSKKKSSTKKSPALKLGPQELLNSALSKFTADKQQKINTLFNMQPNLLKKVTSLKSASVDTLVILFQSALNVGRSFASLYGLVVKNLNPQGLDDRAILIDYLNDIPANQRAQFLQKIKTSKLIKKKYDPLTKKAILQLVKSLDLSQLAGYHAFFKTLRSQGFFKKFQTKDIVRLYEVFSEIGENYQSLFEKAQQLKLINKKMAVLEASLILRSIEKIKDKDFESIITNLSQQLILTPETDADDVASILEALSAVPVIAVEVYGSRLREAHIIGTGFDEAPLARLIRLERDSLFYTNTSSIPFLAQIVRLKNDKWSDENIYTSYNALKQLNILTPADLQGIVDIYIQNFKDNYRSAEDIMTILSTIWKIPVVQRASISAVAKQSLVSSGNLNTTDNILSYIKNALGNPPAQ